LNILIIEDEKRLAEALGEIMKAEGYRADIAYNGLDGLEYCRKIEYDAVILDRMLPGLSGLDALRAMRRDKISTPVLVLTAKGEVADKVAGLDAGADDYLSKPFSKEELLARVRAISRRSGDVILDALEYGSLRFEIASNMLSVGEKSVHLSYKEAAIMHLLMTHGDAIITKEALINRVWGANSEAVDNTVEAQISFLRKKLAYLKSEATIETVRKFGYRLSSRKEK